MLKDEHAHKDLSHQAEPFTYGDYLRVPELLDLQVPLKEPPAHDEMLFIIVQQVQELWFKQVLYELRSVIAALGEGDLLEAVRLQQRVNKIMSLLADEAEVLEMVPPSSFHEFRHVLTSSSGLESEQFRELELASGLSDHTFLKLIDKFMDVEAVQSRWPTTLRDALRLLLSAVDSDHVEALVKVYTDPSAHRQLFMVAESLSEYEVLFSKWRFHHVKLVERTIGDRAPGTAGSSGAGYLGKTLSYRFFPELWEARNRLAARS